MKYFLIICSLFTLNILSSSCTSSSKNYTQAEIESESKKLAEFFNKNFEAVVKRYPTYATYLGRKDQYDKLNNNTYEYSKETLELEKKSLEEMKKINFDALDPQSKISYKMYEENVKDSIESFKYFYHGFFVSQMFGEHSSLPSFLINMHQIANESEANAYVSRLNGFNNYFDQLLVKMKVQEKMGVRMPNFSFDKVIRDSKNIISGFPFQKVKKQSTLYKDLSDKLVKAKIPTSKRKEILKNSEKALLSSVYPAYQKFITYMTDLKKISTRNDGVWSIPNGQAYYKHRLKKITTTDMTAPEIHKLGLKEVERIRGEMRVIMKKVGFKGDLSDFFKFMKTSKKFYYPNTKAGRASYLKDTNKLISNIKGKLDLIFKTKPKADVKVRAVEAFREKSAGIAFYQRPAMNGSRPGIYYVNLSDMKSVAKYDMEALAYHEAIPGHHMQLAISQELKDLPMFRKMGGFTAFTEGWGLYSEYIPKEMGFYTDPYSDFGRLSMEMWRACRLVVDTGLHHYKWSREKAIEYLNNNTPNSMDEKVKGIERYIVMPGQATAYKIGQLKILSLREKAKTALGDKFDIKEFHDRVLTNGSVPMNLLESNIDDYIKSVSL